jgi:predicted unusual protein kinase regulating ubiquinone biosynthesis (AarF/ABC1/UbiB family)
MNLLKIGRLGAEIEYQRNYKKATPVDIGKLLVKRFPELGPSFIKIGQFMSTRDDIFGEPLANELKALQDSTTPIKTDYVDKALKALPLKSYELTPVASASIGQVNRAYLQNGQEVAIKIRRPAVEKNIKEDFEVLLNLIKFVKLFTDNRRILELEIVFREYYSVLLEEIDFAREVANMKKFRRNFKNVSWVKVPQVHQELCTRELIVMEFVDGLKVDKLHKKYSKEQCKNASKKIIQAFIMQFLDHRLVHIDPHPGNLAVTPSGQLVFYDYGMCMDISTEQFAIRFDEFLLYLFDKDAEKLGAFLVETGIIEVLPGNMALFKAFVKLFLSYTNNLNIQEFRANYLKQLDTLGGMPFFISSKFVMMLRGLAILEGVVKAVDPDFNYQESLMPFVQDKVMSIDYFEKKVQGDIKLYQDLPTSFEMAQLQIEVLEKKMEQQQANSVPKAVSVFVGVMALIGIFA